MEDENKALKKAMKQAKASFAIEGMEITKEEENLVFKKQKGLISDEEFIREIKKLVGIKES